MEELKKLVICIESNQYYIKQAFEMITMLKERIKFLEAIIDNGMQKYGQCNQEMGGVSWRD